MNIKIAPVVLICLPMLVACGIGKDLTESVGNVLHNSKMGSKIMTSRSAKLKNLEFTCVKEQYPPLPQEADQLYRYALYHDFKNRWLPKPGVLDRYLPYYRIAAANGHWQANLTLQEILLKSKDINIETHERRGEGIYWNEKLMKILPASAHYWWSRYIAVGYGPKHGADDAKIYLRKAADLGNAKAQYEVRELIMKINDDASHQYRIQIRNKLQECAAEQMYPNADAALMAEAAYTNLKDYKKALFYAHQGTKAGKGTSALSARDIFYSKNPKSKYKQWGIPEDKERSRRYGIIYSYLNTHAHLKPELNVQDLDDIVPLPPAKLPAWDGKIAIQRFAEGVAPVKPSDELVRRLAQQAGLDPQTGLPK
ncbi:hypothetical protein HYE66_00345 [Aggregatibacter actinomycetemcomitans]|nr:hypothetical protein [Aggregatibacter actinomycetemcomitans]